jgi:hypothetical protein
MNRFVHPKRRKEMSKLSTYALAIAVSLGTTAMLDNSQRSDKPNASSEEARLATDGAFRDGMYLGKLAAESGRPLRPTIGRWSTDQDRTTFTAGYRRGYNEALARIEP